VLRYAARATELAGPDGARLEEAFVARLAQAESNEVGIGTGREVYLTTAKPKVGQFARLAGSVAAARMIAPGEPQALAASAALRVEASDGSVTVHQRRTGEEARFDVAVRAIPGALADARTAVAARVSTTPPLELMLSEMTERQRVVIESGVRRHLMEIAFGAERSAGATISGEAIAAGVVSEVTRLVHERTPSGTRRLIALLDLLELERLYVPFDAQTRFHDVLSRDGGELDLDLAAIAARLGFAKVPSG
jgi:hypothetical protein